MDLIACIVYHICMCVLVHVGHAKVIVGARSPLYMMGGYVTKAWDGRLLYKVLERRPRSQYVVMMAMSGCKL